MKKILLTGFEPFGENKDNPSLEAVKLFVPSDDMKIKKLILPVEWKTAAKKLFDAWDEFEPDGILMTGLAGGSDKIRIERVAVNICGALKDATGLYPDGDAGNGKEKPVRMNAPDAYFSTYNHTDILNTLKDAGIPASYSYSAGTYLCNYVMFSALDRNAERKENKEIGFIHVPYAKETHKDAPSMKTEDMVRALELIARHMISGGLS